MRFVRPVTTALRSGAVALSMVVASFGCGFVEGTSNPPAAASQSDHNEGNRALGIARFEIQESPTLQTITGLDASGTAVATYEVRLGEYVMSPLFAEGVEGLQVDGRRITIDVRGDLGYYEGVDHPDTIEMMPPGNIGIFVRDPHVAPVLARWGIFYRTTGLDVAQLDGEVMSKRSVTLEQSPAPSGMIAHPGYSDDKTCTGIACGYVFGVAGTQEISQNVTASFVRSTDTMGACALGNGCAVCGGGIGTPAPYFAMVRANTTFGDLPNQTYAAEMCTNPNHNLVGGSIRGPFFELKACRINGVDPIQCPSGGQYTSCGCTANDNIKCKPCALFLSEQAGRPPYVPPFGEIDATPHNPITDAVSDLLKHHGDYDWNVANFLQWTYGPTCRAKNVYCTLDDQCCEHNCQLTEFGWGKCTPPE